LGPDLSRWKGPFELFQRAITHPDADIDARYQSLIIVLDDGRILTGIRRYEDSYHVLLMDSDQGLRSIARQQIEELAAPNQSLMTALEKELSAEALRDLYGYIISQTETPEP
jgi:putative heme-binding domain-containing protein